MEDIFLNPLLSCLLNIAIHLLSLMGSEAICECYQAEPKFFTTLEKSLFYNIYTSENKDILIQTFNVTNQKVIGEYNEV